jgi:hypothetical protein
VAGLDHLLRDLPHHFLDAADARPIFGTTKKQFHVGLLDRDFRGNRIVHAAARE